MTTGEALREARAKANANHGTYWVAEFDQGLGIPWKPEGAHVTSTKDLSYNAHKKRPVEAYLLAASQPTAAEVLSGKPPTAC
jgi:hypothetical protein